MHPSKSIDGRSGRDLLQPWMGAIRRAPALTP